MDSPIDQLVTRLSDNLDECGSVAKDFHLDRKVKRLSAVSFTVHDSILRDLENKPMLKKFDADWERMRGYLDSAVEKAKEDTSSRQLLVLNTHNFLIEMQCFQLMQFLVQDRLCIVYQRAGDLAKFKDDVTYFAHVIKKFTDKTAFPINELKIIYGDFHKQIS